MSRPIAFEWLKAANDDLMLISNIIEDPGLTHMVAFHCQQAIEKSLKAALEDQGAEVPRKHDLLTLKDLLAGSVAIDDEDILESLNSLYIDARYPGSLGLLPNGKPTVTDAKGFYDFAKAVHEGIYKLISNR
jgi:HEPN domain-containing protein